MVTLTIVTIHICFINIERRTYTWPEMRHNFLSTEASKMLADLVGGQVLRFHNTSPVLLRMEYTVGGNPVDPAVVRELATSIGGARSGGRISITSTTTSPLTGRPKTPAHTRSA
jgi:hypothetical protein